MNKKSILNIVFILSIITIFCEVFVFIISLQKENRTVKVIKLSDYSESKSMINIYKDIEEVNGFNIKSIKKNNTVCYTEVEINTSIDELKKALVILRNYEITDYDINIDKCMVNGKIQIAYINQYNKKSSN